MMHNYNFAPCKQTPSSLLKSHKPLVLKSLTLSLRCVVLLKPSTLLQLYSALLKSHQSLQWYFICTALLLLAFRSASASSVIYAPIVPLVSLLS